MSRFYHNASHHRRDKNIFAGISRSRITRPDGLLHCDDFEEYSSMFTYGEQVPQACAVDRFQDNGWMQCPVNEQWPTSKNTCFVYPPVHCYNYPNVPQPRPQYYHPVQKRRADYVQHPIYPNLPCQQTRQWDYDSMCYNVDGQPCQFTSVVDLEDFM